MHFVFSPWESFDGIVESYYYVGVINIYTVQILLFRHKVFRLSVKALRVPRVVTE